MEKSIEETFKEICQLLDVPIKFQNDETDGNKVTALFDFDAIISKFTALAVYSGAYLPGNISPSYTRVNADLEFWKQKLETKPDGVLKPE